MKKLITILTLSLVVSFGYSQGDVPFEKDFFKANKSEFKDALKHYKAGVEAYTPVVQRASPRWNVALEEFGIAYDFNPKSATLNFYMGVCYLNSVEKFKALKYFQDAYKLKPTVSKRIHYYIGKGFHLLADWDKANYEYELYRRTLSQKDQVQEILYTNKRIEECKNGKELEANPIRVWIDNLGKNVNSVAAEYSPMISADESLIMFTTRRAEGMGEKIDAQNDQYMEDIFYCEKDAEGNWMPAVSIGDKINTDEHDATSGLSANGQTLYVYYDTDGGDIFVSHKGEKGWSKTKNLGKNVNGKKSHETSASLSFDKKQLYYVSNKEGSLGLRDIFYSEWNEAKESWGPSINLGPEINTPYEEVGVVMHPDGKTLYFSSKGHKTMGGYDISSLPKKKKAVGQLQKTSGGL